MVQLTSEATRKTQIKAKAKDVIAMILDVETTGRFFPGVDAVEKVDEMTFKFTLAPRRTLGITFVGEYTSHYKQRGSVVDFLNLGLGPIRTGIFNVADVAFFLGVGLLLWGEREGESRETHT